MKNEFDKAMFEIYETGKMYGYYANYFLQMLHEFGGVETAKRLLAKQGFQEGLTNLWRLKLLNHSMEALVVQERFKSLFTEAETAEARRRLEELGYFN